jgi:hypothetical protein
MQTNQLTSYKNTARFEVISFIESLSPTSYEMQHIASIMKKSSFSCRDVKIFFEYLARRAENGPLLASSLTALGLPALPREPVSRSHEVRNEVSQ